MSTKKSEIIVALKETLNASSIHSVPNLVRENFLSIRIMWLICLLGSASYCIYSVIQSVQGFLNYDVISITRENYENPLQFPVVSICNLNFFSSEDSKKIMNEMFNDSLILNTSGVSNKLRFFINKNSYVLNSFFLNDSLRKKIGYSLDQIMVSCIYSYQDCNIEADFESYFDPLYGNCFRFNSYQNKTIASTGSMNGLQIELFSQSTKLNENIYSIANGFYIFINSKLKFDTSIYDGIQIQLGQLTNIILSKFSISKQPNPYSNCIANLDSINSYSSINYRKTFENNNGSYNRGSCLDICYQAYVGKKCGCYDVTSDSAANTLRPCLNLTDQQCDNDAWNEFVINSEGECECPYECDKIYYAYSLSASEYPTKSYAKYLMSDAKFTSKFLNNTKMSYDELRTRIGSVNIFYNEMVGTTINERIKMDPVDLMSSIGGILGLFLGMSFLSFIELLELAVKAIILACSKKERSTLSYKIEK